MAGKHYGVAEVAVEARAVAGVRVRGGRGEVSRTFRAHLDQVYAAGRDGVAALDGQNIFIYLEQDDGSLQVDFCVGVTSPFTARGLVVPMSTPAGIAATAVHVGDYTGLGAAHAAILDWCRTNDRQYAGPSWEVYGHWHADPSLLRTDVYYLLQPIPLRT